MESRIRKIEKISLNSFQLQLGVIVYFKLALAKKKINNSNFKSRLIIAPTPKI
jgi:hypothetical protein